MDDSRVFIGSGGGKKTVTVRTSREDTELGTFRVEHRPGVCDGCKHCGFDLG